MELRTFQKIFKQICFLSGLLYRMTSRDLVFCHVYMVAVQTNRMKGGNTDAAFISLLLL